tara:strand:+ start:2428 stop:2571 length:144 start_codon:yes stop_codon:yes gene_type:complete
MRAQINYQQVAKVREAKDKDTIPPGVTINYELLGRVLEAKARLKNET